MSYKPTNHIVLILDRSGSMESHVPSTIKGVNEIVATAKNVQKQTGSRIKFTCIGFETVPEIINGFDGISVQKCPRFTTNEIFGVGGTKMYDAYALAFTHIENKLKSGDTLLVVAFTDGETGGDTTRPETIHALVTNWQNRGYTFAFIAPKSFRMTAVQYAAKIAIPSTNVMEYETTSQGFRSAFWKLSRGLRKYLESLTDERVARIGGFFENLGVENSVMKVNGLEITMNMPESVNEKDKIDGELPPYAPVNAYVVDEYPSCPANWMNGSAKASSYFVGVKENHGMWLDFNKVASNDHEIAVVISVQGVNPITGQKTSALRLEKYENKCPVHDKEFGQERFCKECGFKWPSQNYISTNATPNGMLWLDGFRSADGKVRQYVFTEDQAKGVAAGIIGRDRVYAIGIAFYLSKKPKPKPLIPAYSQIREELSSTFSISRPQYLNYYDSGSSSSSHSPMKSCRVRGRGMGMAKGGLENLSLTSNKGTVNISNVTPVPAACVPISESNVPDGSVDQTVYQLGPTPQVDMFAMPTAASHDGTAVMDFDDSLTSQKLGFFASTPIAPKTYEIGAGAKLDQQVYADPQPMDYWEETPFSMLYITYTDEKTVKNILANGKRKEVEEGFLAKIPVVS